ncbi:hypothetical protein VCRA2116O29_610001 [Vibrio crassostreae]|nr:hypothetical protein VCRA2116O29_610001 [Vibrio crassostreae]CAK2519052.1 hypothetical protein VCRA2119O48_580001 [Vibrio crassostreae]CAK3406407.1 hypothetical protein VCRA2122O340_10237 [Vibrio crassostreae]CAK3778331.1 hypothetical protein VCRA2121O335_10237 [Vibrio crassostreae]CAK3779654.1 hypothetical protein VCRA2121O337_10240 [Vibrio crassostreae]
MPNHPTMWPNLLGTLASNFCEFIQFIGLESLLIMKNGLFYREPSLVSPIEGLISDC